MIQSGSALQTRNAHLAPAPTTPGRDNRRGLRFNHALVAVYLFYGAFHWRGLPLAIGRLFVLARAKFGKFGAFKESPTIRARMHVD